MIGASAKFFFFVFIVSVKECDEEREKTSDEKSH
jgi:hypothetical protein